MNRKNILLFCLLLGTALACKKIEAPQPSSPTPPAGTSRNLPPVAILKVDKVTVTLPTESMIRLDASSSYDLDGAISNYLWRKISGPECIFTLEAAPQKATYYLSDSGNYFFEVTVVDNAGSSGKDTIQVTALYDENCSQATRISPNFSPITHLRDSIFVQPVVGRGGNKLFVTSGAKIINNGLTRVYDRKVYMYDFETGKWESGQLSTDRAPDAIVSDGEYVVFSGGYTNYGVLPSRRLDIYHIPTGTWSQADMQTDRTGCSVAIIQKKVVIAGGNETWGYPTRDIEIYDLPSGVWTRAQLSEPRSEMTLINDGQKLYFGGGVVDPDPILPDTSFSNKIDIYDAASGQWSVSNLSRGKYHMNGIAFKGKTYWAGGTNNQSLEFRLEIMDHAGNRTELDCMGDVQYYIANGMMTAAKDNNSICFMGTRRLSLYEPATRKWSAAALPPGEPLGIVNINSKLYVVLQQPGWQQNSVQVFEIVF